MKVLFFSDCHDYATQVGRNLLANYVAPYYRKKGIEVVELYCSAATREKALEALKDKSIVFFSGCGHGNENVFTGWLLERVFWTCDSKELAGRGVYLLSCETAKRLGRDIVEKGAKVYAGYYETFCWVVERWNTDPYGDRVQASFFRPVERFLKAIADGKTMKEAVEEQIDQFNKEIEYWRNSGDPGAPWIIYWLTWDRDGLRLYGDESWRLAEVKELKAESAIAVKDTASAEPRLRVDYRIPLAFGVLMTLGAIMEREARTRTALAMIAAGLLIVAWRLRAYRAPAVPRKIVEVKAVSNISVVDKHVSPVELRATSSVETIDVSIITPATRVNPESFISIEDTGEIGYPTEVEGEDAVEVTAAARIEVGMFFRPSGSLAVTDTARVEVRKNIVSSSSVSATDEGSVEVGAGVTGSESITVTSLAKIAAQLVLRSSSTISTADTGSVTVTRSVSGAVTATVWCSVLLMISPALRPSSTITVTDTGSLTAQLGVAGSADVPVTSTAVATTTV